MQFLNNPWLWGGLAAAGVAVPIIIHLLNRYRHRQVDWAAMELLKRAMTIRSRQIRIEDILLLILRCAAILMIAAALVRPTVPAGGSSWMGRQNVGAVVAIDASYSMAQKEFAGRRFDRAKARAEEILATFQPGDPVTLVLLGSRPHVLLPGVPFERTLFEKTLKEAEVLPERLNLDACLEDMKRIFARGELKAAVRECYVITDAQQATFAKVSPAARETLRGLGGEGRLFVIPTGADSAENVAVTRFQLESGVLRKGMSVRFVADVKNFGKRSRDGMKLGLFAREAGAPHATAGGDARGKLVAQPDVGTIAPGATVSVPVEYRCETPGDVRLTAELARQNADLANVDEVPQDNARYLVAHVREQVRVLLVDGEPSDKPMQGETDWLRRALVPKAAALYRSLSVQKIPAVEMATARFTDYDVVVLANVGPDIAADQVKALGTFAEQGGGLVLFPGKRVDAKAYNKAMQYGGGSLLPGQLGDIVKDNNPKFAGWGVEVSKDGGAIASAIRRLPVDMLAEPTIRQYVNVKLGDGGHQVLGIAGTGSPLLAHKPIGRGAVMLWTTTADRDWADLVLSPAYLIALNQSITDLTARSYERPLLTGQPMALPVPDPQAKVMVRAPGGGEELARIITAENRSTLQYAKTDAPGFYELAGGKDVASSAVAVNVDPGESDVQIVPLETFRDSMKDLPVRVVVPDDNIGDLVRQSRVGRELWPWFLSAGLALLVIESLLAMLFSRRMASRSSGADARQTLLRKRGELAAAA